MERTAVCAGARFHFSEKAAFSLRRYKAMKVTISGECLRSTPRYELQPVTMARMENRSTWGSLELSLRPGASQEGPVLCILRPRENPKIG